MTVASGDTVTVEMATHHACDDCAPPRPTAARAARAATVARRAGDKMIKGDAGMESIYTWSEHTKRESFRGASGGGDGVHVLTGPIAVDGAEPGDVLESRDRGPAPARQPRGQDLRQQRERLVGFSGPRAQGRRLELRRRRLHLHPWLERRGHHDLRARV